VRLIDDDALRTSIGQAVRQAVLERFSPVRFNAEWHRQIEIVLEAHSSRASTVPAVPAAPPVQASVAAAPVRPAPTRFVIWRDKLRRALQLVLAGDRAHYVLYTRAHLSNLWWLFKVNRLKRL